MFHIQKFPKNGVIYQLYSSFTVYKLYRFVRIEKLKIFNVAIYCV